jgi:hypothetical protein
METGGGQQIESGAMGAPPPAATGAAASATAAPRSGKAIAAIVVAVAGVLIGWFVFVWLLVGAVAIVLAILALRDIREGRAVRGRRLAWSAIVVVLLTFPFWVVLFIFSGAVGGGGAIGG